MALRLVIGNYNYSSWSLRAWLYMKASGIEFEEIRIPLFTEQWHREIGDYTPARRVPVLLDGALRVWDTMAIMDHLRERHRDALGWPDGDAAKALARSIAAEMHSGFLAIREEMPLNIRARTRRHGSARCRESVQRIVDIWTECRRDFGTDGPWLFGGMSIPDVMYAPVALRFRTYGVEVPGPASEFLAAVEGNQWVREWTARAHEEAEALAVVDDLKPLKGEELSLG